ncbi:replicative DNA helicase [Janthinobacterium fluminis]|uniref:Replicative DNA helicase n=1 Tax=Janthinobacterium fluminis TaxID=2987524 RepID=A0ABT5JU32_9BURK|nr:replicative DNA helicase [Janthinobacterium fluminis]MDC8756245.1 replicative DNA helicase [Janthinobacterium fluminis]
MSGRNAVPVALEAEQSVIGALLRENGALDRMGELRAGHFFRHDHGMIFAETLRQITAGKGCDVVSVGMALAQTVPDCMAYLNAIAQSVPSAANIGRYADLVRDRALRRGLMAAMDEMAALALNPGSRTAGEVLDAAQSALSALAETRALREPVRASLAMMAHIDVLDDRVGRKYTGIPTGFAEIDALLTGGPNRGALVILGARPSMGKTALALNIATNVARDYSVLFLSQEMQNGELLDRALAALGHIPLGSVIRGDLNDADWVSFGAANARLNDLNLHLDDQPALTLLDVRGKARLIKRKHGLDLLVVDYLQLMSGEGDNRNSQIEEISRGLKALAKELNIVVLALSQLSRNAANKSRPQLSDLRDSGAIEQDADIVMFVHRDEVDNPQSHLRGCADVFIAKNRQGRIDDVMLAYEGMYTQFSDSTRPRPAAPAQNYSKGLARHL